MKRLIDNILFLVICGLIVGSLVYLSMVHFAYQDLKKNILEANWLQQSLEKDPSFSGALYNPNSFDLIIKNTDNKSFAWRLLTVNNIIDDDTDLSDVAKVFSDFFNNKLEVDSIDSIKKLGSLEVLLNLIQSKGYENQGDETPRHAPPIDSVKYHVASCLAGEGGSIEKYDDYLRKNNTLNKDIVLSDESPNEISIPIILNRLFLHYGAESNYTSLPNGTSNVGPTEEYRQFKELCLQILTSIYDDPKVASSEAWLENIKGPEQFTMICLFFIAVAILIRKKIGHNYKDFFIEENPSKRLRSYYSWIFSSLTAIGFIGTIRGLSKALGSADIIFRSSPGLEQAISISMITEVLGIAFSTTLIALILTLTLGFLKLVLDPTDEFRLDEV